MIPVRRHSDHFKFGIVKTTTGYEARRTQTESAVPATESRLFLNFRTAGQRAATDDTFTLKGR